VQNLIYALIQVVHNFGAVAIVGLSAVGVWRLYRTSISRRILALILAAVWAIQGTAGAAFGVTTLWFDGQLPDIHGIALMALSLKIVCTLLGFALAMLYVFTSSHNRGGSRSRLWLPSFSLGVIALTSAAFLRWFS